MLSEFVNLAWLGYFWPKRWRRRGSDAKGVFVCSISELQNFEYRKVHLVGVWDHAHTILIGPKSRDNTKGYHIITPLFRPNNSSTILVNRGFVSADIVKAHPEWLAQERGEVQVMGLLRSSQEKNTFTPENNPEKGEWYWVDVEAIAERAGGLEYGVQPVYIESTFGKNHALTCCEKES